jgi:hypothetical protein
MSLLLIATPVYAQSDEPKPTLPPLPAAPPAETKPPAGIEGTWHLRRLLDEHGKELKLTTGEDSASDRFSVALRINNTEFKDADLNSVISRDGDKVSMVVWSRVGKHTIPKCIVANGIVVALDPQTPGGVLIGLDAQPDVTFAVGDGITLQVSKGKAARVVFDMKSLLQRALDRGLDVTYFPTVQAISAHTKEGALKATLSVPSARMPTAVDKMELTAGKYEFGMFVLEKEVDPELDFSGFTADAVSALRVPAREWISDAGTSVALFTPRPEFHNDAKHRATAAQLYKLVHPQPPTATAPANRDADKAADGTARLKAFLAEHGKELELSTEAGSVSDRFFVGLVVKPTVGKKPERSVSTAIFRDRDRVSMLVRSAIGEDMVPTCVVANGVGVGLDVSNPGGIVLMKDAQPDITIETKGDEFVFSQWVRRRADKKPFVRVDIGSVLRGALEGAEAVTYEEATNVFTIHRTRTKTEVKLAGPDSRPLCPVKWLVVTSTNQGEQRQIQLFVLGRDVDPSLDFAALTPDSIAALRLPTRPLEPGPKSAGVLFLPPAEIHTDYNHRAVGGKIYNLVFRQPPQSKGDAK